MSERQPFGGLTEKEIEEIAEKAAEKAVAKFYLEIGKATVKKALMVIGAGVVFLLVWLGSHGQIPKV
jgi:hypothetical protein